MNERKNLYANGRFYDQGWIFMTWKKVEKAIKSGFKRQYYASPWHLKNEDLYVYNEKLVELIFSNCLEFWWNFLYTYFLLYIRLGGILSKSKINFG